ncbi:DUF4381 domain-containing protein [Parahaliea maris]|uniref:DUF4381 domain-containing protein n=1 Tax=Parahaliea maris TaxID=2716870 RepID=A0A5C8ZQH6_9GAMM|nr:DUF4381 domain-containing protein [Parahaliea maris]TXS90746.1 DUF4381 domain-containing protein [Parahaliea maris]
MKDDPASLANLHDIIVPGPVPLWPPPPGWLWLLGILALALVAVLLRALVHWQRNHYRREALAQLKQLSTTVTGAQATEREQQQGLAQLSVLLKRTALTAYPRAEVAELTGREWFAFLDQRGNTRFSGSLGQALENATYCSSGSPLDAEQLSNLFDQARRWIKHHAPAPEHVAGETPAQ